MIDPQEIANRMIAAENAKREIIIKDFMLKHGVMPHALIQEVNQQTGEWKIRLLRRGEMYLSPSRWKRFLLKLRSWLHL